MNGYYSTTARDEKVIDAEFVECTRKKKKDKMLTAKWWDRFIARLMSVMILVTFIVSLIGVLAIPVVMAYFYSPMWVLLYGAYFLVSLLFVSIGK